MTTPSASEAAVAAARALLAAESVGVLSTISVHRPGFPYGSVTPYALSAHGQPLLLLSRLAAHTKNLLADPRASLFVGDRSGTILRVTPERQVETYATIPASVAAFHLAMGPDDTLYVTGPTLATHDALYRITRDRLVDVVYHRFGRPQGLAFEASGTLYVVDALAGAAALYRLDVAVPSPDVELVLTAPSLVGVAFDPAGGLLLASSDTVWRLDCPLKPLRS